MQIKDVLLLVLPFISGFISALITYFFTYKVQKNASALKFKEEKYANLVFLLKGFVGNTASAELKKEFFDEQHKAWLYSSDEVVEAINRLVDVLASHIKDYDGEKLVGNIILRMRKDLIGKTNLTYKSFHYIDVIEKPLLKSLK